MSARRWSAVLAAVLLAGCVGQAAAGAPSSRPDVQVAESPIFFSPNGDGHRDRARVRFSLDAQATVSVLVRHGQDVVRGPERMGRLGAGRHAWTWDGRRGGGAPVKDGTFSIVVRATIGGRTDKEVVTAYVDRLADAGRVVTTRPTVYPKASVVSDRVDITYLREGWNAADANQPSGLYPEARSPLTVDLTVVDAAGRVVWRRPWTPQYGSPNGRALTFGFTWHARGAGGEPLPEGTYRARVRVTDAAGNTATYGAPVTVSHQQLRAQVWTSSLAAASATRIVPAGCGELCQGGCLPVASGRFDGGLGFPACADTYKGTRAWFTAAPPVEAAPVDTYRITATGGPATPGAPGVGSLWGYRELGPGDATATTPWLYVDPDSVQYLTDPTSPVQWGFSTSSGNAYDVASFTIEYRSYVPEV